MARVRAAVLESQCPTAQAPFVVPSAATPSRTFCPVPKLGLGWTVQAVPFQCSTRVRRPVPLEKSPIAQAFEDEVAATPRRLGEVPGLGLGWIFQAVPFQCSTSVFWTPPLVVNPTAQALERDVADTAFNA